jgi:DNA-binding HxlR family transcriptional regulator
MSFLGGAWTPNILWYLREGPRRFNELRGDINGISAKVLSARLQRLAADGIVERRVMPTAPPTVEYELTDLGRVIIPAVDAIVAVGHRLKERRPAQVRPTTRDRSSPAATMAGDTLPAPGASSAKVVQGKDSG